MFRMSHVLIGLIFICYNYSKAEMMYFTFEGTVELAGYSRDVPYGPTNYMMPELAGLPLKYVFAVNFDEAPWRIWADGTYEIPQDTSGQNYFYSELIYSLDYLQGNGPGSALVLEARVGIAYSEMNSENTMFGSRYNTYARHATIPGWLPGMGVVDNEVYLYELCFDTYGRFELAGKGKLISISSENPVVPEPSVWFMMSIGIGVLFLQKIRNRNKIYFSFQIRERF